MRHTQLTAEQQKEILSLFQQGIEQRTIASRLLLPRKRVQAVVRQFLANQEGEQRQERAQQPRTKRQQAKTARYLERKASGTCRYCDLPALPERHCCERHEQQRSNRRKAVKQGLKCNSCGNPPLPHRARCSACAEKNRQKTRFHIEQRKKLGLCSLCGKAPYVAGKTLCQNCLERAKRHGARKKAERRAAGLCDYCGKLPALSGNLRCADCYFRKVSESHFGTVAEWQDLRRLFEASKGRCPYSNRPLVLGVNAALDHIIPIAKQGPQTLANVQWVDATVNQMKRDLGEEEFLALVRDIFLCRCE